MRACMRWPWSPPHLAKLCAGNPIAADIGKRGQAGVNDVLCSDKTEKRRHIAGICRSESKDIGFSSLAVRLHINAACPFDRRMPEIVLKENIGGNPSMAAISIRKWMDLHHPVMKASGGLLWRKNRMLSPIARIVQENPNLDGNLKRVDADIFLSQTISSRPRPDVAK